MLELLIDRDGRVKESRVVEGTEPFSAAALAAAPSWRFAPALRAGQVVEARVRVRVEFVPPALPERSETQAAPSRPARRVEPPAPSVVEDVVVRGVRPEPPHHEMSGSEVRQLPGAFGDAFRAIEALPGIIPIVSGLPYFLVRGAPPGNTGFFIDGVRVPALFHLGVLSAVVHPGLIDRVDLYPGSYPARFGRFTGGFLSGEVLPFPDRPLAEGSVRLIDAEALAATPIADSRGAVMVSGRFGYPGPLLKAVAAIADPKAQIDLEYWDYQVRGRWRATDRDELGAFVFGSFDMLSESGTAIGVQFHRADLRWDHRTSPTGRLRLALTLGYDELSEAVTTTTSVQTGSPFSPTVMTATSTSTAAIRSGMFGLRTEWTDRIGRAAEARVGADVVLEPYNVAVPGLTPIGGISGTVGTASGEQNSGFSGGFRQTDLNSAVFGELVWRPTSRVEVLPGLRADLFTSRYPGQTAVPDAGAQGRIAFDPRLTARWHATPSVALVSALGVAHQPSNIPLPFPALNFSQLSRGLQTSYQYSEGVELKLPLGLSATANAFLHDFTGLADFYEQCPDGQHSCTFGGRAIGLEILVRRRLTERFTGWLSYTLSRVERDATYQPVVYGGFLGEVQWTRRISEFDRTHVFNAVLAADLGKRWRAGARVIAYSGLPYASYASGNALPDSRGPPFVRLDVRLEKSWLVLGGRLTFVFEWLNALLQKESVGTQCTYSNEGQSVRCAPSQLPVPITFPSIGLEGAWGE